MAGERYTAAVERAIRSRRDVVGAKQLDAREGPTFEALERLFAPLMLAQQRENRRLTSSGVYYLAFSYPPRVRGSRGFALHVADGSEVITRRFDGQRLAVYVGVDGRERYGSCFTRLGSPRLAGGYLPILQTEYVDGVGAHYRQESFAGRVPGVRSLVSLIRIEVDARAARAPVRVRLISSIAGLVHRDGRLLSGGRVQLVASGRARPSESGVRVDVRPGHVDVVYALWFQTPSAAGRVRADRPTYDRMRESVVRFWNAQLDRGAAVSIPEPRVQAALRAILVQQIAHVWRYSIGNQYEEFSVAEGLDTAEVMARYGFRDIARAILETSSARIPKRFTAWRASERFLADAAYYRLFHERAFLRESAPVLGSLLTRIEAMQIGSGPATGRLRPERLCSDLPEPVDGVASQIVVWHGLRVIERVWAETGHDRLAARARAVRVRLEAALRRDVPRVSARLRDGSLFVPATFTPATSPYDQLTATRPGSYWNLVVPYGLATGFFEPRSAEARGIVRYLLLHGSRLAGVTRADAHVLYRVKRYPNAGMTQVYGLNVSRFLADNDRPEQLVLSLYGMLATSMTRGTYVSGESVSVTPVEGEYLRRTYYPPNQGANSTFLETLRVMLVAERHDRNGAPRGLDLAFATPRAWLENGRELRVRGMPTSFGRLSFSLERRGPLIRGRVTLRPSGPLPEIRVRLRVPRAERITRVFVDGRPARGSRSKTVDLPRRRGAITIVATVSRRA